MATESLSVKIPPKFKQFIKFYQSRHEGEIWDTCEHVVTQDTTVEYIMRITMPIIDYTLYKEIFGDELEFPRYDMGKLLVTLIQAFEIKGMNINTDIRLINGKPQHAVLLNDKIVYTTKDGKSYKKYKKEMMEIKERIPKVLAGDSSQLINYMMPGIDQRIITESSDVSNRHSDINITDAEIIEISHIETQNKPPIETQNKPPIETQNKPPIETQNRLTINIQSGDIADKIRSRNILKSLKSKKM